MKKGQGLLTVIFLFGLAVLTPACSKSGFSDPTLGQPESVRREITVYENPT